jgi:hypothetical protein
MDAPERTTMTIQGVEYVVIRADLFTALEQERDESYWYKQAQYRLSENDRLRTAIQAACNMLTAYDESATAFIARKVLIDVLADEREK